MHFKRFWLPARYTNKFQKMTINGKKRKCDKIAELHLSSLCGVSAQCWRARHRIVFVKKYYDFASQDH